MHVCNSIALKIHTSIYGHCSSADACVNFVLFVFFTSLLFFMQMVQSREDYLNYSENVVGTT